MNNNPPPRKIERITERASNGRDYHAFHPPDSPGTISTTVIHALADVMGRDVSETGFVLFDNIDPDALDRIFADTKNGASRSNGHVAFSVERFRVTVYSSGDIVITPPDEFTPDRKQ